MPDDASTEGIVSESEMIRFIALFLQFEGAKDPLCKESRDAKDHFNGMASGIYRDKVRTKLLETDYSIFVSQLRNECRKRLAKQGKPFPCS